ncbi:hypothetical protein [Leptospira noguchii]|uniref:hypothetical protein n=1 Tax=Leptospira noguchii TaxID=28182 RepID=UPI001FB7173C|nr:hypothetical protein [Leptospira noguchii]UOG51731.1 hypothetical protein MAL09_13730 [Leptospira noguchii]
MWGGNSVLQRICRNSHRFNIEIQILVGLVMTLHGSLEVTQRLTLHGSLEVTQRLTLHGSLEVTQCLTLHGSLDRSR